MKFFQLNKMKTPLVVGAMLLGAVACSDYDTEIAELSDRLDDVESLNVTISSMEEQISSVEASIPDLTSIYSRLEAIEGVDLDALKTAIDGLNETIESTVTEDFLTNMLDNVYLTEVSLDDVQAVVGDENAGLISDIIDAKAAAAEWVGNDELANYLLITDKYTDEDAKAAATEYFESIKSTLVTATEFEELKESFKLSSDDVTALDAALTALESRVAELEGRIQSLVFVPETSKEYKVEFAGKDYVTFGTKKYYLTPVATTQSMTFQVSPASWAEKLTLDDLSLCSNEYTRSSDAFAIKKVTAGQDGKFTIDVECVLEEGVTYGYGLALNVAIASADTTNINGTDITTEYVSVSVANGDEKNDNIVYGGYYNGVFSTLASEANTTATESLTAQYNNEGAITFFSTADWYVLGSDTTTFASKYADMSILSVTKPTTEATASANADSYKLTATTAEIVSGSTALIGDVITSDDYTFALTDGTNTIDFGTAKSVLTISQLAHEFTTTSFDISWKYGDTGYYQSPDKTTIDGCIKVLGDMSAEMFNGMYGSWGTYYTGSVYDADGNVVAGAYSRVYFFSAINGSDDFKPVQVTLYNMPTETANYTTVISNSNVDGDLVKITVPINYEGVPAISNVDLTETFNFAGQTTDSLLSSVAAKLWAANATALEGHVTEADLETIITGATKTYTGTTPMELNLTNNGLAVEYNDFTTLELGKKYTMSVALNDAQLGDFTTITANVTLANIYSDQIQAAAAFVDANENVEIETVLDTLNNTFSITDKNLISTHTLKTNPTGVTMVYSIAEDLTDWTTANPTLTAPEVDASGILVWNGWNSTEIAMSVKAVFTIGATEVAVDSKAFTAYITSPLGEITTTNLALSISDLTGTVDLYDALSLLENKSGSDFNVFTRFEDAFGETATFEYVGTNDETTPVLVENTANVVSFTSAATTAATMTNPVEYTFKATYKTDYFGTKTAIVTVVVNN